ncbi:hypothetical protein M1N49_00505 [Thermodesulfovibrionales bacterium]|nr:hypothetical protein [Thermodesulfovibrionales bacterium]
MELITIIALIPIGVIALVYLLRRPEIAFAIFLFSYVIEGGVILPWFLNLTLIMLAIAILGFTAQLAAGKINNFKLQSVDLWFLGFIIILFAGSYLVPNPEAGYFILHYPKAVIYHERAPINRNNKLFIFYGCRNELYTVIRRYPLFLVPVGVFWKVFIWNWAGAKKLALHFTLGACIIVALKFPWLLLQRKPVSLKTIKKIMTLRGKSRKI